MSQSPFLTIDLATVRHSLLALSESSQFQIALRMNLATVRHLFSVPHLLGC